MHSGVPQRCKQLCAKTSAQNRLVNRLSSCIIVASGATDCSKKDVWWLTMHDLHSNLANLEMLTRLCLHIRLYDARLLYQMCCKLQPATDHKRPPEICTA